MSIKMVTFYDVAQRSLVDWRFKGAQCLHHQSSDIFIAIAFSPYSFIGFNFLFLSLSTLSFELPLCHSYFLNPPPYSFPIHTLHILPADGP